MSHWYRLPRALTVKYFLERAKRDFILDEALSAYRDMFGALSRNVFLVPQLCPKESSAAQVAAVCQKHQGILATANSEFVDQLNRGSSNSWGLLLLPEAEAARQEVLGSLFSGLLTFRSSTERSITVEQAPFSSLLFDLRRSPPVLGIFYRCQQSRHLRRS
jgi:hypothetical protein